MTDKPKLEDLLPKRTRHPTVPKAKRDALLIDAWIPHFVAFAFRIEDSIRAAFPAKEWSKDSASLQAAELLKHPAFKGKMTAHIAKLDQECEIDERFVLSGLYHQACANLVDYLEENSDGHFTIKNLTELPVTLQRNIKELTIENIVAKERSTEKEEIRHQRIRFKIVDSQKAYVMLGKAIGMFIERIKVDVNHNLADKLEEATERVKRKRLEAPKEQVH